jgi:hypothetical protein
MCNACGARGPSGCQDSDDEEIPGSDAAKRLWNSRAADPHITVEDERYARELLDDLKRDDISPVAIAVKWFRKARHECVRAASDTRAPVVSSQAGKDVALQQFGKDIWITDKPVPPHTDGTIAGNMVYGLVLINTGYDLIYEGKRIKIPSGSIYTIDGNKEHSTEGEGLLAVLIWDMPDWTVEDFKRELSRDIRFKNMFFLTPAPGGMELADEWRKESVRHSQAAAACDIESNEWELHREASRIYKKCANALDDALVISNQQYPLILNGDHAEFEIEHANTKPEDRPDWPLPSFDARDWAKAFCKLNPGMDEETMLAWFANALMRGFDEHGSRTAAQSAVRERTITTVQEKLVDQKFCWCIVRVLHDEEIIQNFGSGLDAKVAAFCSLAQTGVKR